MPRVFVGRSLRTLLTERRHCAYSQDCKFVETTLQANYWLDEKKHHMGRVSFLYSATAPQSAIIISMRFAPIVSMLVMSLALNAKTIQGKVVRVSDGDTITILDEVKVQSKIRLNRIDAPEKKQAYGEVFVEDGYKATFDFLAKLIQERVS